MHRIQKKFPYLTNADIEDLSKFSKIIKYDKDSLVIEYGKHAPYFYYVVEGLVRGYRFKDDGEDHNWFFVHTDQYFISPDKLFNKEKKINNYIFETVSELTVFRIQHDELMHLASQNQRIFEFYHDALKTAIESLFERIRLLTIDSAEERYKDFIKARPLILKYAQKKHIAQFLGITPNSFSRLLRRIEKE